MTKPNYNLIRKHVTPEVITNHTGNIDLLFNLLVPMSGELTVSKQDCPSSTYTIKLTKLSLQADITFVKQAQGGLECIEFTYEYDENNYDDPDVRDYVSDNKVVAFIISTALVNAGFSPQAATNIREVDSEIHGIMYFDCPGVCQELHSAMLEQLVKWESRCRELATN